jgi:hypothetical protein
MGANHPEPNRQLDDGTPCWCVEFSGEHTPRCLTLRGLTGGYDFSGPANNPSPRATVTQRQKKVAFLNAFRESGVIQYAADAAGVHRTTVQEWRGKDPAFDREYEEAYEASIDVLEQEARRRALVGVSEPVYQNGKKVGDVQKYSDTLLIFLMKGARPQKYRDNARLELTGADGGPIKSEAVESLNDHERVRLRQILDEALRQQEALEKT